MFCSSHSLVFCITHAESERMLYRHSEVRQSAGVLTGRLWEESIVPAVHPVARRKNRSAHILAGGRRCG